MNSLAVKSFLNNNSYYPLESATTMKDIPDVLIKEILSFLGVIGLGRCLCLNRIWRKIGNERDLWKVPSSMTVFGKQQWIRHLGKIGEEPPIPKIFFSLFERPCPNNPGKKIKNTHKLILMPGSINGLPFTITNFIRVRKSKNIKIVDEFDMNNPDILPVNPMEVPTEEAQWLLITKDPIWETVRGRDFTEQCEFLPDGYKVPNMLQALVNIFESAMNDPTDSLYTITQCSESLYDIHPSVLFYKSSVSSTIHITKEQGRSLGLFGVLQ